MENLKKSIDFAITSYCQAKCRSCIRTNKDTGEAEDWLTPRHQPYDLFEKYTAEIDKSTVSFVKFCGQTGDPMMHPQISNFVDHAFNFADDVQINTNGGLRSTDWYQEMAERYGKKLTITFGIDGIDAETNWKYRENVNFERAMENMKTYANSGGRTVWHFLVFDWNWHQIPNASLMSKEIGVDKIEFKLNTATYGLLNPKKNERVNELICRYNT